VRSPTEDVRGEFDLPKVLKAPGTRDRVVKAVCEEKRPLFVAQVVRSTAVNVEDAIAVEGERVIWLKDLTTL